MFFTLVLSIIEMKVLSVLEITLELYAFFPVGVVGFPSALYTVREDDGYVWVCVVVKKPRTSCPIPPVNVTFNTIDGTAGTNTL